MSYRNIIVDGEKYQYITGKTHTKVKGVGVVENIKIGEYHVFRVSHYGTDDDFYLELRVKPKNIAKMIKMVRSQGTDILKTLSEAKIPEGYEFE